MTHVHRSIRLIGAVGAQIRTALFEEREHLVVPVVALIGGEVIFASNADGPELVPASAIEKSFMEWNGRPVVGNHPHDDERGRPVSANDPHICERQAFGRIANPRFENDRLLVEAWLDRRKAERVGADAVSVIKRAEAGEPIEVSIGAYVDVEPVEGVNAKGVPYVGVWHEIGSDHLAMLPEGMTGACSGEMGCGAPRIATRRYLVTASGLELQKEQETDMTKVSSIKVEVDGEKFIAGLREEKKRTLRERLRGLFSADALDVLRFRGAADESVSDADLRSALDRALFADEPGYLGIDAVFPAENLVVYATAPDQVVTLFRRGFSVDESGGVTLAETKEAVEPVTRYEPVAAAASDPATQKAAASCDCHNKQHPSAESAKEEAMSKLAERIKALIAKSNGRYAEADSEWLAKVPEDRFAALEAEPAVDPPAPTTQPPETPKAEDDEEPKPETVAIPAEELAGLRRMAAREEAREKARKDQLVATLKGAQSRHPESKLKTMSVEQLEDIAAILGIEEQPATDYTGRGFARAASADEDVYRNPPSPYGLTKAKEAN